MQPMCWSAAKPFGARTGRVRALIKIKGAMPGSWEHCQISVAALYVPAASHWEALPCVSLCYSLH